MSNRDSLKQRRSELLLKSVPVAFYQSTRPRPIASESGSQQQARSYWHGLAQVGNRKKHRVNGARYSTFEEIRATTRTVRTKDIKYLLDASD